MNSSLFLLHFQELPPISSIRSEMYRIFSLKNTATSQSPVNLVMSLPLIHEHESNTLRRFHSLCLPFPLFFTPEIQLLCGCLWMHVHGPQVLRGYAHSHGHMLRSEVDGWDVVHGWLIHSTFWDGPLTELGTAVLARQDGCRTTGSACSHPHGPGKGTCYHTFFHLSIVIWTQGHMLV